MFNLWKAWQLFLLLRSLIEGFGTMPPGSTVDVPIPEDLQPTFTFSTGQFKIQSFGVHRTR